MDLQNSNGSSGEDKQKPSLIDLGTFFVDADIIFGFTSHLLKRKAKVEGCSSGESSLSLELSPRRRLSAEEELCAGRPAPEGAGAVSVSESDRDKTRPDLCKQCQMTVAELRRQALALSDPASLKDPGFASFIIDQLQVPDWPLKGGHEGRRCQVCGTPAQQLKQQALQTLQELYPGSHMPSPPPNTFPGHPTRLTTHNVVTLSSRPTKSRIPHPAHSVLPVGERQRELGWSQSPSPSAGPLKPSVQVTMGGRPLTGTIGSVTIQAQQYLEGMWSISRVNNFLPQPNPSQGLVGQAEQSEWSSDTTISRVSITPSRQRGQVQDGQAVPSSSDHPSSAAASFFIRAAQKLNLSSKRKKQQPPLAYPQEPSIYPTNFSAVLQFSPPPAPPCLLRAGSKAKENPGMGKVKVMMRICPSLGVVDSSESMSFLKVDTRKKQLTLYDPSVNTQPTSVHRRAVLPAPKMFAFDAVFSQDASQAEVCSGTVAEVIQSVVNGADGCIFCFGHVKVGKTYTMIGTDSSMQGLGIAPCAISWLFKLINERKEKTGTRFSVRVSAVEIYGKDESLQDLLSDVPTGSLQDGQSPGVYLREDPICGTQLQNQSELRAPTAEKAALFLDAAIAARSTNRPDADEEDRRNSHMLFTLHIYQYRMEKSGKGGMSGGRSRLHLIDLGSCEKVLCKSRDAGGGLCLSLTALGNVILALANGAKHVPYRDSKLTMLLRDSLGNINCRTTMIAHISDSPANYAESLTTIQLASRIHRMRKKKSKYASSSSGGESSCDEGRIRRPPHLRPFHPRTVALDPDLPSFLSDPDYSSSSEQSCDTVIYVGPGGASISDRELSDNEGPPAFVPIIPSLNRKQRGKEGPVDHDHFKCNTFAELQERLECIDGSEEPTAFVGESGENSESPKMDRSATKLKEGSSCISVSPKTPTKALSSTQDSISQKSIYVANKLPSSPKHKLEHPKLESAQSDKDLRDMSESVCRTSADGEKVQMDSGSLCTKGKPIVSQNSEPVVREKVFFNKKLPKPAPPPPQQRDYGKLNSETEEKSATRIPPIGMSHQKRGDSNGNSPVKVHHLNPRTGEMRSNLRERCMEKDILRTTVTLKQPVELNGEDELVFTLVEELSIGSIVDNGRPSSIVSFNSDCSLQALASGSRPVSIISSINDEFDAYTCNVGTSEANIKMVAPLQDKTFASLGSRGSSITSWLSEVSVCTLESEGAQSADVFLPQGTHTGLDSSFYLDSLSMFQSSPQKQPKNSLNDSGCSFSDLDSDSAVSSKLSLSNCPSSPEAPQLSAKNLPKLAKANTIHLADPKSFQESQVVQCSLSRKLKPTSSIAHSSSISGTSSSSNWRREPPRQDCIPDAWHRVDSPLESSLTSHSSSSSRLVKSGIPARKAGTSSSVPRMPKTLGSNPSQRVVDGCEKTSNNRKMESPSRMPQLRRGATTLGIVPVIHPSIDVKLAQDIVSSTSNLKFSSLGKSGKASKQEESMSKPGNVSPPPPPVRKSSLDQKNRILFPSSALKSAYDAGRSLAPRATGLEDDIDICSRVDSNSLRASNLKAEHSLIKATSSLKSRGARSDTGQLYGSQISLDRCDSLSSLGSKPALSRENSGASLNSKSSKSVSRFGSPVSTSSPIATSPPSCINPVSTVKNGIVKGSLNARPIPANTNKARTLSANNSKALSSSTKSLVAPATRNANLPPSGKTALPRATVGCNGKSTRGTIMGTKQAMRAANSRVSELALANTSGKQTRGSGDSDSGNDSGVNLNDDKHTPIPILPSPYSKITAPRRPQRYSSGHGSDNSSVLSGELPPAMGRTALFYHSGGSSGYESMIRDSEATGSASSAHDSMSESGMSSSGRTRISKAPKKRSNGLQRRRLIPAPLPDASSLGKSGTTGQWVDLPPMTGPLKEPFEIKVYEIDDVERLQRRRQEKTDEGLMYFNTKLKVLEKRQLQIRDLTAKHKTLKEELEDTKSRLMMDSSKWIGEFEVDEDLDQESQEYFEALEQATAELEYCVNLCKSRVMMVTCFDIRVASDVQEGPREVEV
ncbi:kinesin-like protein KIF26A isoform X1 [Rhinichthys klamathensis goyatoka]|uniref:kinesin-like protein KIF26A isoform X1 n=1 Tax=Rhinichthys klamathensis goyatoka TaxID=3034132 RepID=UPI0024B4DBBF|nr:kinesin-like protein KIF26A isoform X1 [Rhinichthys klamathensis goyatoka]